MDPLDPNQHRFSNDPRSNPLLVNQVISKEETNPQSNIAKPSIVKKVHKPVQAKTKSAVLAYTEEFDPIQLLDDASLIIKDIFEERTITPTSSPENVRANIKELFGWFLGHYYRGYEKRFGFTVETMKAKLWPNKEVVKLLLNNLETAAPGLTRCDVDNNSITYSLFLLSVCELKANQGLVGTQYAGFLKPFFAKLKAILINFLNSLNVIFQLRPDSETL